MAKKQFIRHLEFYGFPDQNGYSSDVNGYNVDLSEIIKKNKEQDKEIKELSDEKASKKDLDELSGTVESIIAYQSDINQAVADSINELREIDNEFAEQISALTNGVNDAICGIQNLNDRVDDVQEDLDELSGKVETLSAETADAISGLSEDIQELRDDIDETYAKKEDVYTKDEVDEKIDEKLTDFATKEWVEEQGYLDVEEGDERYAKKETVDALDNRVNSAVTDLNTKIFAVSGALDSYKTTTDAKIGSLETNFEILSGATDRKINAISGAVQQYDDRINQNAADIDTLEDEMARKANKTDLEALENAVDNLSDLVDTKVSKTEFEQYKGLVSNQFNNMDDKKADKSGLTAAMDAIEDTNDRIDQEIADREAADGDIINQITNINNEIIEIKEQGVDYGDRIQALESGLTKEIADRQQADLDLIGTTADTKDADTIWGAKAFAKNIKNQAISEANSYTNQEISGLRSEVNAQFNNVEQALSAKADKSYVDDTKNELKAELENDIESAVQEEEDRALLAEGNLLNRIIQNSSAITDNDQAIDNLADKVNAITEWDGHESGNYTSWAAEHPDAAGVLDVLHREFHQLIDTLTQKGILP